MYSWELKCRMMYIFIKSPLILENFSAFVWPGICGCLRKTCALVWKGTQSALQVWTIFLSKQIWNARISNLVIRIVFIFKWMVIVNIWSGNNEMNKDRRDVCIEWSRNNWVDQRPTCRALATNWESFAFKSKSVHFMQRRRGENGGPVCAAIG